MGMFFVSYSQLLLRYTNVGVVLERGVKLYLQWLALADTKIYLLQKYSDSIQDMKMTHQFWHFMNFRTSHNLSKT